MRAGLVRIERTALSRRRRRCPPDGSTQAEQRPGLWPACARCALQGEGRWELREFRMEIEFVAAAAAVQPKTAVAQVVFEGETPNGPFAQALAASRFTGAKGQTLDLIAP